MTLLHSALQPFLNSQSALKQPLFIYNAYSASLSLVLLVSLLLDCKKIHCFSTLEALPRCLGKPYTYQVLLLMCEAFNFQNCVTTRSAICCMLWFKGVKKKLKTPKKPQKTQEKNLQNQQKPLTRLPTQLTASPCPGLSQSMSPLKVTSLPISNIDLDVLSLTIFFKIHHLQTKFKSGNLISNRDNK